MSLRNLSRLRNFLTSFSFVGRKPRTKGIDPAQHYRDTEFSSSTEPEKISLAMFYRIVDRLSNDDICEATKQMYHKIWCNFNRFLLCFDDLPTSWEEKLVLYAAFLADIGNASATVSTYMSAIRYVLNHDGVELNDDSCRLASIIRACKLHNDVVSVRLPIGFNLLNLILNEMEEVFMGRGQPYLAALYKAITASGYYGMMRISEMVGKHAVITDDVKISKNPLKCKVKFILRSSKTHHCGNMPQIINIVPDQQVLGTATCPYNILSNFSLMRPRRIHPGSQFFVFSDGSWVTDRHYRSVLRIVLKRLGLSPLAFNTHSLRIGRASTLFKRNWPVEQIQKLGRWKNVSTAFKYFK